MFILANRNKFYYVLKMGKNTWLMLKLPYELKNSLLELNTKLKTGLGDDYDPMDYELCHMTLAFLGSNFNKHTQLKELSESYDINFNVTFEKIMLFPPDKENLLVLKYKTNKDLTKFVLQLKKDIYDKFGIKDEIEGFTAHITLGKLYKTKANATELVKKVNDIIDSITEFDLDFDSNKIEMSG